MRNWQAQPRGGARIGKRVNCSKTYTLELFFFLISIRAVIDTFFRDDISEVNYVTCQYIIDNIQTHLPF